MNWKNVKIKEYNGYKLENGIAYAKAQKLYTHRYPSNKTIETLKKLCAKCIIYQNGDFIQL